LLKADILRDDAFESVIFPSIFKSVPSKCNLSFC